MEAAALDARPCLPVGQVEVGHVQGEDGLTASARDAEIGDSTGAEIGDSTGKVGNDTVSSLTVAPGNSVVAYLDPGLKGEKVIFTENTPYVGDQYNDRISSVSVKANSYLSTKLSNFPPQGDIYQLAEPVELEDVSNPGPVLATIQAFPVTVNPPG